MRPLYVSGVGVLPGSYSFTARRAAAHGGIAPVHLLDVQTLSGEVLHWSDRGLANVPAVILSQAETASGVANYAAWLLSMAKFTLNRSTQTDTGTVTIQNLSGDVLQSDFERIVRGDTLEGAMFVYRYYSLDMQCVWLEIHGTMSVSETTRFSATLALSQMLQGQDDTPEQQVSETCQLEWGLTRCGATGPTPCLQTYASCQVVEHFVGIQTAYETNNPAAPAQTPITPINRARPW